MEKQIRLMIQGNDINIPDVVAFLNDFDGIQTKRISDESVTTRTIDLNTELAIISIAFSAVSATDVLWRALKKVFQRLPNIRISISVGVEWPEITPDDRGRQLIDHAVEKED